MKKSGTARQRLTHVQAVRTHTPHGTTAATPRRFGSRRGSPASPRKGRTDLRTDTPPSPATPARNGKNRRDRHARSPPAALPLCRATVLCLCICICICIPGIPPLSAVLPHRLCVAPRSPPRSRRTPCPVGRWRVSLCICICVYLHHCICTTANVCPRAARAAGSRRVPALG